MELSEYEQAVLKLLRQAQAAKSRLVPEQRVPVHRPEKFRNPVGIDDTGQYFPDPAADLGD